ncbi:hypothetical protein [Peribacillus butanolivorans]|uniref:hypothetical protein n=1 Tax=Peribacillus butanolivorans TaxID=421767 RepID=UPI0037FA7918
MSGKLFNNEIIYLSDNIEFHFININELNLELVNFIDENFVSICKGENNKGSIERIKKRAIKFFSQKDERTRNGATAEFFLHLYLRSLDYKQECMFLNMEENSIKKGFDGYYSQGKDQWILESKSGNIRSKNVKHSSKISEAYASLNKQLRGEAENDPWQNAYQHANSRDVGTNESILSVLQNFSDDFIDEKYHSSEDLNIIPAATVFLNGVWEEIDIKKVHKKILKSIPNFKFKKIKIICCTKKSLDLFMDFLGVPKREERNEEQRKNTANIN